MSISSLVIHARRDGVNAVRAAIEDIPGVEVHAVTETGQLVVTVDQPDDGAAIAVIEGFRDVPGILSTSLVYSHFEEPAAEQGETP